MQPYLQLGDTCYRWQKLIGCLKLQVIFRKRATNYRALLRKMTYEDKASYDFTPPCGGMVISFHVKWDDFISFTCKFISHVKCEWVNDMCRSHVTCVWIHFTCEMRWPHLRWPHLWMSQWHVHMSCHMCVKWIHMWMRWGHLISHVKWIHMWMRWGHLISHVKWIHMWMSHWHMHKSCHM